MESVDRRDLKTPYKSACSNNSNFGELRNEEDVGADTIDGGRVDDHRAPLRVARDAQLATSRWVFQALQFVSYLTIQVCGYLSDVTASLKHVLGEHAIQGHGRDDGQLHGMPDGLQGQPRIIHKFIMDTRNYELMDVTVNDNELKKYHDDK